MIKFERLKERLAHRFQRAKTGKGLRFSRRWRWLLAVPLGLYGLYVVGASAFVFFGGMTWVTKTEKDVRIDVRSGYSLFPGRFHVEDLRVQFKDYNVELSILAQEADLSIALHQLLKKRIHIHWARASGVEYQMLHRVKDREKSAKRLAAFPEIVAFDRPPYYDTPRPPRSDKKPWSLLVDSIEADAALVWIMEYQLRGRVRAKGAFYTDPRHEAEVLPCHVEVTDATISVGEEQIAHDVEGNLSFALSPFSVRDAPIEKVLPKISAKIGDFSARIDTLSFTQLYFSMEPLHLQGRGELEIDTTVTRGQIDPGSIVSLAMSPLTFSARGEGKDGKTHTARGDGQLSFQASPGGHLNLAVHAHVPPAKDGAFSAEKLEARAALEHEDITAFDLRGLQFDLKALHFDRPDFSYALLGRSPAIPMSGTFHLHGEADLPEEGSAQLEAKLQMLSTSFYFEGQRIGATADTAISCLGTLEAANCGVDFHAPHLRLDRQSDGQAEVIWLRLKTRRALRVHSNNGTFQGPFVISGGDPKNVLSEWLGKAWLPQMGLKLVPTGPIAGSFTVQRTPEIFSLSDIDISIGKTHLEGKLTTGKTTHAIGTLEMPTGRWGFESTPSGVRVRPFIGRHWIAKQ